MSQHTATEEQDFLNELDKKLWNMADRLRSNLDAAVYKQIALALIFLKYLPDSSNVCITPLLNDMEASA